MRWTNAQRRLFDSPYRLTVAWGGNGQGKSKAAAELTRKALARQLYWQQPARIGETVILAGNTWSQLGSTLEYFWELIDPRWFKETLRFEGGRIQGQRLQVYDIIDGPARGGCLRCGTFRAENLAGPRAGVVVTDEPLPEDVHNELWPRLFGRGGRMYQNFTPAPSSKDTSDAKLDYLWDMVDNPELPWAGEIQTPLTLDAVTPRGGLLEVPWATQLEIDQFESGLSAVVRDCRMGRTRRKKSNTAYYSAWGAHLLTPTPPLWFGQAMSRPVADQRANPVRVGIGIDHGSKPGAQRAILAMVFGFGLNARVWIADEYAGDGRTDSEQDAAGILAMLERQGIALEDVDQWVGDRAHGGDWRGGKKSNFRLQQAIAEAIGISTQSRGWKSRLPKNLQRIHTPAKKDKSVYEGADIIHRLMLRGPEWYAVSQRCTQLDRDHTDWQGGSREPAKDGCDGERYIVVPMVEGRRY